MLVIYYKDPQSPRVKLPNSNTYYEKSLLLTGTGYYGFLIDDTRVINHAYWSGFHYVDISSTFTEGTYVNIHSGQGSWGMIVILYS